jgi:lysyl-tRNA synthetase, class II
MSTAPAVAAADTTERTGTRPETTDGWKEKVAVWTARLVTLAAFWSLISIVINGPWADWIDEVFGLVNLPTDASLFTVVLLFVLGNALSRRIRFALWIVIFVFQLIAFLLGLFVAIYLLSGQTGTITINNDSTRIRLGLVVFEGATGLVLGVLLWRARSAFPARVGRGSRWLALLVLAVGIAVSAVVAIGLTQAFPADLRPGSERILWPLRAAIGQLPAQNSNIFHGHHGHHWIAVLAGVMSAAALVLAAIVFLRSARAKDFVSPQDELDVRRLVLESGERDSLGYFATRRDKSVVFSPDRRAAVTYRVVAEVSLASADPVGHMSSWPGAIEAWIAEARHQGWFPAALSASEAGASAYVAAGLKAIEIGDEAIIEVESFSLVGPTMAPVRRAVERVERAGYTLQVARHGDLGPEQLSHLESIADQWRADGDERGFSMALSRLADPADPRCVAVLARDADGALKGLLSFVPWGRRGLSLDLMRRDRNAENGITEFLVAGLVDASRDLGVARISLNFAMFRGIFSAAERVGAGPVMRLTGALLSVASKFWQLESLYRSNAKYLPRWVPRYMCHSPSVTVTRAAIAAGVAEGFLPGRDPVSARGPEDTVTFQGRTDVPFAVAATTQAEELLRPARPVQRLTEQERVRRRKIETLEASGMPAYPVQVARSMPLTEVCARHRGLAPDTYTGDEVSVAGRVRAVRDFGSLVFGVLQDNDDRLQVMVTDERTGADAVRLWRRTVDLGDYVSVTGEVATSRTGELSVAANAWTMAAKCLRPVPNDRVRHLGDPDTRVRQRYLDLIVNPETRTQLRQRSVAVRALRDGFGRRGFTEVETPMLQAVHGGANARPFITHINAYDTNLYLRIAPELFLKKLAVGGMSRVFELNRNFRNEGADATHNPEFTSLEAYQAWADYNDMRDLTRELIIEVATAVHGRPIARRPTEDGGWQEVDLSGDWPTISVHEAASRATGVELTTATSVDKLRVVCDEHGIMVPARATAGAMVLEIYDELVEGPTEAPTFYTDFPLETSPLTRVHREDPLLSERWDLVAFGAEIGTAYSELIDPVDQRERLTIQSLLAAAGDPEAMQVDESFLTALEYAMPPTGGLGVGVDRLVMMLTGTNIRSTLAFPFVRPDPAGHG